MEKMKTSIPRLGRKEKSVSTTYNLPIHLTSMITHGHNIMVFGHFGLPFLDTGSNFIISSLSLCLSMLEDPMVDEFGNFLYEKGSSIHPLHDALLQNESYEKSQEYKRESMQDLSMPRDSLNKLPLILFLQLNNCGGDNKNHYLFSFASMLIKRIFLQLYM
jgi:hypothetical protein